MSCTGQGKGIPSKHLVTLLVLRGTILIYFWLRSLRILTVVLLFSHDFDCRVTVLSWFWLSCYCSLMILTVVLLFSHDFDCRVTVLSGFWLLLYSSRRFWLLCSLRSFISMIQFSQEFCYCSYWCLEMVKNIKSFLNMASFNIGFYLTFSTKHFVSRYD